MSERDHEFGGFAVARVNGSSQKQIGPALHVGYLPGRKSPCLYMIDGSVIRTLAFFRAHKDAVTAYKLLGHVIERTPWEAA